MEISRLFGKMPSFGFSFGMPNMLQKIYKNDVTQALVKMETPFDLYIEMVNLMSRIPGMNLLKIDKKTGLVITWEEINEIWKERLGSFKKLPKWTVKLLKRS